MQISVQPAQLRPELARSTKIATNDVFAVGSQIEIHAGLDGVFLRAHDGHTGFVAKVDAEISAPGTVLVSCSKVAAILGTRPDTAPIKMRATGAFLNLQQGEFKSKLPLFRSGKMKEFDFTGPFDIDIMLDPETLHGMRRCLWSMDDEEATFAGLLLDFSEEKLLRVAAFTRAVLQVGHFDVPAVAPTRLVLSPKSVSIFSALPSDKPFRFAYSRTMSTAYVFSDTFAATIACMTDGFPSGYQAVLGLHRWREGKYPIPVLNSAGSVTSERPRSVLTMDRDTLSGALSSVVSVLDKEDQIVAFRVVGQLENGQLVVEMAATNTTTKAAATEKLLATGSVEQQIELGLNCNSMKNVLRHIEAPVVEFHVGRSDDPIVVVDQKCARVVALATLMRL